MCKNVGQGLSLLSIVLLPESIWMSILEQGDQDFSCSRFINIPLIDKLTRFDSKMKRCISYHRKGYAMQIFLGNWVKK